MKDNQNSASQIRDINEDAELERKAKAAQDKKSDQSPTVTKIPAGKPVEKVVAGDETTNQQHSRGEEPDQKNEKEIAKEIEKQEKAITNDPDAAAIA